MATRKNPASLFQCEDGQSLIEFALTLPLLLTLVTGICSFGVALNNLIELTNATSLGARQFALMRGQGGDACAVAVTAIAAAAPLLNNSGSTTGLGYSFTAGGTTYNSASPSCPSVVMTQGQLVKATITYPCSLLFYGHNIIPSCQLTAQSSELIQ